MSDIENILTLTALMFLGAALLVALLIAFINLTGERDD